MIPRKLESLIISGLYLSLFLPIIVTPFTAFRLHFGKVVLFQALVEVLVFLYLLFRLQTGQDEKKKMADWFFGITTVDIFVFLFLVILVVTSLTGITPANSFWGNQFRANGVFTWLHFGAWYALLRIMFQNHAERWQHALRITTIVAGLVALTGFFQSVLPESWWGDAGTRLSGVIGNPSFFGAYAILAFGSSLALFFSSIRDFSLKEWLSRPSWPNITDTVIAGLGGSMILIALILTRSRGALLGLMAGVVVGCAVFSFLAYKKQRSVKPFITWLIVVLGISALLLLARNDAMRERFPGLAVGTMAEYFESSTGQTRLMAWQIAWQGIKERPLLGWGMENFQVIFDRYHNPNFLRYSFAETVWDKPHNWLLEIAVSAGIPGLIFYLLMIGSACFFLLKKKDAALIHGSLVPLAVSSVLVGTFAGYSVQSAFLFETSNSLVLFFFLLAFAASMRARSEQAEESGKQIIFRRAGAARIASMSVFTALLLWSLYCFHFLPLKASYHFQEARTKKSLEEWNESAGRALAVPVPFRGEMAVFLAEQFTDFERSGLRLPKDDPAILSGAERVVAVLEEEGRRRPEWLAYPNWAGQVYTVLGEQIDPKYYEQAESNLLRAAAIAPRKQEVLFSLGKLYLLKKEFAKSLDVHEQAIAIAPDIHISHWFYGLAHAASGNVASGLEEMEQAIAFGYSPLRHERLYLIDLYALAKKYDIVVREYTELLKTDPENVTWYMRLAAAYVEMGETELAHEAIEKAVAIFPLLRSEADKYIKEKGL